MLAVSTSEKSYHHGDLRRVLLEAAIESLEAGDVFSMRAVARRAGVSPTAPYRHFADRRALDSAVAVAGFDDLRRELQQSVDAFPPSIDPVEAIAGLGVAYVASALRRPAVYRLMFGNECDPADSARVQASGELHRILTEAVERFFPRADAAGLTTALWALAHGLASLHLDGKFRPEPTDAVAHRVRTAVHAILTVERDHATEGENA